MAINISIIIPHKGREEFLKQTIESILGQDYAKSEYEILIVTQNESLTLLDSISGDKSPIKIFYRTHNQTISALRNYGASQASGNYFAFLDADVKLSPNWLKCMLTTLQEQPSRLLVSACQINGENPPPLEKIRTALSNVEIDTNVNFLPGRNLFLSRETFDQVNGFPEHLVTCEDYYFTDQVSRLGQLFYSSKANYVHLGEDKRYGEMYKKEIWRGQSNLASISGRKIPLREWPSFIIPIAIAVLLLLTVTALINQSVVYASFSLLLLITPFLVYSARLKLIAREQISYSSALAFYLIYFPARAIGTLGGIFKSFSNSTTK